MDTSSYTSRSRQGGVLAHILFYRPASRSPDLACARDGVDLEDLGGGHGDALVPHVPAQA
jgi:hypothetical protein